MVPLKIDFIENLKRIMNKVESGVRIDRQDAFMLLSAEGETELEALYFAARNTRERIFQEKVFLYGFVYFSTYCRNNCNFCYYRKENRIPRYRKKNDEVLEIAKKLARSGVNLIDLTMGEDPDYHREDFRSIVQLAKDVKKETGLPVMISTGLDKDEIIDEFAGAGVEWYALYQETHNRKLFEELRVNQSYDERLRAKLRAQDQGMHIEEGILVGIGESLDDIAGSIIEMGEERARQMRVMSFVPQSGIPMEMKKTPPRSLEYKVIATMRILYPEALIPASLDVDGIQGLRDRMNAGANVITSIIPPEEGLMGVAQNTMDVDDGGRTVEEVEGILRSLGLRCASNEEYTAFLKRKTELDERKVRVAIIGGKLQGLEAVYLAKKAGYHSIIIDKKENPISRNLADEFFQWDVRNISEPYIQVLKSADFVLPAIENDEVLEAIVKVCERERIKLAFDPDAYRISSSKIKSDRLMHENQIPAPEYYPGCEGPYIAKPSVASGSDGVQLIETEVALKAFLDKQENQKDWVVQEYLQGRSYSIEVIGKPGNYRTYEITEIHMDEVYDCCRVTSPCGLTAELEEQFAELGIQLAELVQLKGIMDVEVIEHKGVLKVLEIDARIPSQTPTAVLHASGINLLKELADMTRFGVFRKQTRKSQFASFEHFLINKEGIKTFGEHIIAKSRPLEWKLNYLGAHEALTDLTELGGNGTFIVYGESESTMEAQRMAMFEELSKVHRGLAHE